ncbi:MAG: hypothetical protein WD018_05240 [Nitrosopumilaceae archaeon]
MPASLWDIPNWFNWYWWGLDDIEKEAQGVDSTLNQLIQIILEAHIESKDNHPIESESWKCSFYDPQEEFLDYFKYSEHFFAKHMQPGLEKLSKINSDN